MENQNHSPRNHELRIYVKVSKSEKEQIIKKVRHTGLKIAEIVRILLLHFEGKVLIK